MSVLNNIYLVHRLRPRSDGTLDRNLVGKICIDGDTIHHLCDYHRALEATVPEGKLTPRSQNALERLMGSSYYSFEKKASPLETKPVEVDEGDPNGDVAPETDLAANLKVPKPQPVFDYIREGMDKPHSVEIQGGKVLLDGNLLSEEESRTVIQNVKSGLAKIRYRTPTDYTPNVSTPVSTSERVRKAEALFLGLAKAEGLANSLRSLRELVDAGHLDFGKYEAIRRELYHDEMVPSIGNKRAFHEHLLTDEGRGGVHIMLDANNFKDINDDLSHNHGDRAIEAMGNAIRRAADKAAPGEAKVHRFGGDEYHIHVPTHEHASVVLRGLRQELEALPFVGGTHRLSMSAGIGLDVMSADHALNHGAKEQKKAAIAAAGGDPAARTGKVRAPHALYVHSAVPGYEGAVPTAHNEMAGMNQQPGEAKKLVSEAAKIHETAAPAVK